jgi:hypothetical protein
MCRLLDPYFHELLDEAGHPLHMRERCHHNNGNLPGPEGCEWCEKRSPHHILRASFSQALKECGLALELVTVDYGDRYYSATDEQGLEADLCVPALEHSFGPAFPGLTAPADHPVWGLLRAAALARGLDPTPWIEEV